jgi:hypothetical protein
MMLRSRMLLLAATLPFVAGCGVYLHDAQLQSTTAEAKTTFDSLGTPQLFAAQRQNLMTAGQQEDAAVAAYAVALRNETVLTLLRPSGRVAVGVDPVTRLRDRVRDELAFVYRAATPPALPWTSEELTDLENAPLAVLNNRQYRASSQSTLGGAIREFRRIAPDDSRPIDCDRVSAPQLDADGLPIWPQEEREHAYYRIQLDCREVRFASVTSPVLGRATGELKRVRDELAESRRQSEARAAEARRLQAAIKAALETQAQQPAPDLDALNRQIAPLLTQLDRASALARTVGLQEIADVLETRVVAELRSTPSTLAENAQAAAALRLINATQAAATAFGSEPDAQRAGALLIGLAMVRHDLNMARTEVAFQEQQQLLLERQLTALMLRASHLARAHRILEAHAISAAGGLADIRSISNPRTRVAASDALTAYVAAWNSGEIPYHVLRYRVIQARRLAALDRAELTEQDYRAVLKPVFDQLAAYGEGGITAENIVTLLGHLGVAGSILSR